MPRLLKSLGIFILCVSVAGAGLWVAHAVVYNIPKLIEPAAAQITTAAVPVVEKSLNDVVGTTLDAWLKASMEEKVTDLVQKKLDAMAADFSKELWKRVDDLQNEAPAFLTEYLPESSSLDEYIAGAIAVGIEEKLQTISFTSEDIWALLVAAAKDQAKEP